MSSVRHFLGLDAFEPDELRRIVDGASALKRAGRSAAQPLVGQTLAMIFEQPSTRTRISFDVAMTQLGGRAIPLAPHEMQLGRGETISDTARVISRYVDAIVLRTDNHDALENLAAAANVPVINGLTDRTHPCQLLADMLTFEEHRGAIAGRSIAWLGDGNNMAATWIQAAAQFGFELRIGCPPELAPDADVVAWAQAQGAHIVVTDDAGAALDGADCVVTDTWVSLADDSDKNIDHLRPYQVNEAAMARAAPNAIFMHCLPAKRGQEVTDAVMEAPCSVVFDEAENRLHAQKGILLWCMAPDALGR